MTQTSEYEMCEQERSARIKGLTFSPFNESFSCVLHTGELNVNDVVSGKIQKQLQLISEPLRASCYVKVGQSNLLAVGGDDGRLRLFEGVSMRPLAPIKLYKSALRSLVAHPKAPIIFTGGDDGIIKVVKIFEITFSTEVLAELVGHSSAVSSLSIDPLGARLCSGSFDGKIKIWDSQCFIDLKDFRQRVSQGKLGNVVQKSQRDAGAISKTLTQYSSGAGNAIKKLQTMGVKSLGTQVMGAATALLQGQINVFRDDDGDDSNDKLMNEIQTPLVTLQPLFTLGSGDSCINAVTWLESSVLGNNTVNPYAAGQLQFAASANDDGEVVIWDTYDRQALKTLSGHSGPVNCLAYIKEEGMLASGSDDGHILLHDCSTLDLRRSLHVGLGRVWCMAHKSSGLVSLIIAGSDDGWAMFKQKQRPPLCAFSASKQQVRFTFMGEYHYKYPLKQDSDAKESTSEDSSSEQQENNGSATLGMFSFSRKTSKIYNSTLCLNDSLTPEKQIISKPVIQEYEDIENIIYPPKGQVVALKSTQNVYFISLASGKQKQSINAHLFAYAHVLKEYDDDKAYKQKNNQHEDQDDVTVEDEGYYAIVPKDRRDTIEVYDARGTNPIHVIEADFQIDQLHSGPLITISGGNQIAFYDWITGNYIAQLDDLPVKNVLYAKNNVGCIICENQVLIFKIKAKELLDALENDDYDDYDGFPEGIVDLGSLQMKATSAAFDLDGKLLVIVDQEGPKQVYIDELMQQDAEVGDASESNISESNEDAELTSGNGCNAVCEQIEVPALKSVRMVLGGAGGRLYFVGTPTITLYGDVPEGEQAIAAVPINKDWMTFKQLCTAKNIDDAGTFAREKLLRKSPEVVQRACDLLREAGASTDDILALFENDKAKLAAAEILNRVDVAVKLLLENQSLRLSVDLLRLAHKAFAAGQLEAAFELYKIEKDADMALLCAYILGDTERIQSVTSFCTRSATLFKIFRLIQNDEKAFSILSTPQKLLWKWARGFNMNTEFEQWKNYLIQNDRIDAADALAGPEEQD